jgi:hypothetical protein
LKPCKDPRKGDWPGGGLRGQLLFSRFKEETFEKKYLKNIEECT